jgi:uncharacterized protein (TIRG00374 family)
VVNAAEESLLETRALSLRAAGVRLFLSVAIATLLLWLLMAFSDVTVADLLATWSKLSWKVYLAALLLHVALYVLRAVRFQILIPPDKRPAFGRLSVICAAHTMAAFILPAKIGEATYVLYLRNVCGVGAAEGIASLVISRVLDAATLFLGLAAACFALEWTGAYPALDWLAPLAVALTLCSAVLFYLSARGDLLVRMAVTLTRLLRLDRARSGARLLAKVETIAQALRQAGARRRLLGATLVSLPVWACIFLFCAVLARGLGLPQETTLADATFGSSLAILASFVPVSAFANFGTLETGWVLGFGVLGVPRDLAIATGTGLHLVQLINVVALGVLGHIGMGILARRR